MDVRAVAALIAASLAAASCGSGGHNERLSKADLVRKANAICAELSDELAARPSPFGSKNLIAYVDASRDDIERAVAALRRLEPPANLEDRYDEWVATGERALDRLSELRRAAKRDDQAEVRRIFRRIVREDRDSNRLARRLGLRRCAEE